MNILVVGAGAQSAPAAAILARQPQVDRVLVASRDLGDATGICDRLGHEDKGKTSAGMIWPEQLDPERFIAVANSLGLTLKLTVS